jgi:hypothetical protein
MAEAFSTLKAQTKRVFNVGRFHLAPSMIVIFLSIPCIYLETPISLQTGGTSNMSLSKFMGRKLIVSILIVA